ncbi:MAG: hypothetical protein Q8M24_00445 [Pseudolabrys sp.]|nr:hypothetical protein [Pseudolabrys sp.]MDP2293915.1 hypothetical protein [Pseudolabrys sp.]
MSRISLFDKTISAPAPMPIAGARTPFWQGKSFVLTLGVQFRYYLQPEMHEGSSSYRVGPIGDSKISSAALWKNLDYEVRNNGRIARPSDPPTATVQITTGDLGVVGYPPMDTYNQITFLSANTSGDYILFIDALAIGLAFSPRYYMVVATVANLSVDNREVWSRTYRASNSVLEEGFIDEHKLSVKLG